MPTIMWTRNNLGNRGVRPWRTVCVNRCGKGLDLGNVFGIKKGGAR
jgi:hypothetical protein